MVKHLISIMIRIHWIEDRLLNYLIPIIRAIDVIDLSKTLEERPKKRDFLFEINSICDIQYKFVYHKVSEQRGILTNLIHNEIVRHLELEKDLLPCFIILRV